MSDIPPEVKDLESWKDAVLIDGKGQGLTQWEVDFIESILQRMRKGLYLTPKQQVIVNRIIEEKT